MSKIKIDNNRLLEVAYNKNGNEESITADYVISTIPMPDFVRMFEPVPDEHIVKTANNMKFR